MLWILIFAIIANNSFAQDVRLPKLSCPEKWWVITHPFIANKAKKITRAVLKVSNEIKNDSVLDGNSVSGQVDAFRHAFWMACLSQKIKVKKALALGRAHEKGNYLIFKKGKEDEEKNLPDSVSCAMDLFNDMVGAKLGCDNPKMNPDSLRDIVITAILEGKMLIFYQDKYKRFLDCKGNILDGTFLLKKWNTPRCLISSDKPWIK